MKTIWKFPIEITAEQNVSMPFGAELLYAGLDPDGSPCIWAKANPHNSKEDVAVRIVGTGHNAPLSNADYLNSFNHGPFVWHVFYFG